MSRYEHPNLIGTWLEVRGFWDAKIKNYQRTILRGPEYFAGLNEAHRAWAILSSPTLEEKQPSELFRELGVVLLRTGFKDAIALIPPEQWKNNGFGDSFGQR